jgi:hypothetical protein
MTAASRIDIASGDFQVTLLTVEMWIRFDEGEPTARAIVFDHESRWAVSVEPGGVLVCELNPVPLQAGPRIVAGRWTHVGCSYDGTSLSAYIDGMPAGTVLALPIMTGSQPAAIGGNAPAADTPTPFVGALDRVRVWSSNLNAQEMCAAAGSC